MIDIFFACQVHAKVFLKMKVIHHPNKRTKRRLKGANWLTIYTGYPPVSAPTEKS